MNEAKRNHERRKRQREKERRRKGPSVSRKSGVVMNSQLGDINQKISDARRFDAINDAIDSNAMAIQKNAEQNQKGFAEVGSILKSLQKDIIGNGDPKRGLTYRISWLEDKAEKFEKILLILLTIAVIETAALVALAVALIVHMSI